MTVHQILLSVSFSHVKVAQSCPTLCDPMDCISWNSPAQNTGVGSLSLPGDLPNPGIKPRSSLCKWILYQLSHKGSPRILEWVAYPSPRDLPKPGIEAESPALQVDSLPTELPVKHFREDLNVLHCSIWLISCLNGYQIPGTTACLCYYLFPFS